MNNLQWRFNFVLCFREHSASSCTSLHPRASPIKHAHSPQFTYSLHHRPNFSLLRPQTSPFPPRSVSHFIVFIPYPEAWFNTFHNGTGRSLFCCRGGRYYFCFVPIQRRLCGCKGKDKGHGLQASVEKSFAKTYV